MCEDLEGPVAEADRVAVRRRRGGDRRDRVRRAVEGSHPLLAVRSGGGGDQPGGVAQVRHAPLVDPDGGPRDSVRQARPAPPAWSRWMWVTTMCARSSGPSPSCGERRRRRPRGRRPGRPPPASVRSPSTRYTALSSGSPAMHRVDRRDAVAQRDQRREHVRRVPPGEVSHRGVGRLGVVSRHPLGRVSRTDELVHPKEEPW